MIKYLIVMMLFGMLALQNKVAAQDVFELCRNGKTAELKTLLQLDTSLVNFKKSNGFTPFIIATYNGQVAVSKLLIKMGADINAQDRSGNTALMGLCFNGNVELVKLLLDNKVMINTLNFNHASALIFAATFGHVDIVQLLLKAGADKMVKDSNGKNAYDQAMMQGNDAVAQLLK